MDKFPEDAIFRAVHSGVSDTPEIPEDARAVDIRRNNLVELRFSESNNVEYLDASDNKIADISNLEILKSLVILDCSYNLIQAIPSLHLNSLKELYLIANDIQVIENIRYPSLIKLDLANNEIKIIENIETPRLEELYLANNQISSLSDLTYLKYLRILDLQYNDISTIDCMLLPDSLEILLLQGNKQLSSIKNKEKLTRIRIINIVDTSIVDVSGPTDMEVWK